MISRGYSGGQSYLASLCLWDLDIVDFNLGPLVDESFLHDGD